MMDDARLISRTDIEHDKTGRKASGVPVAPGTGQRLAAMAGALNAAVPP